MAAALYLLWVGRRIAIPFGLGALITYLIDPTVVAFERKGAPRGVAVLLVYAILIMGVVLGLAWVIPSIARELTQLADVLPQQSHRLEQLVNGLYDKLPLQDVPRPIRGAIEDAMSRFEDTALRFVKSAVHGLLGMLASVFDFVLAPIVAFYLTKDLHRIRKGFQGLLPLQYRSEFLQTVGEVNAVLGGYIRGQLIICGILLAVVSLGLTALKVPFSLILGLFAGLTNIIPYFGAFIGAAPAVLVALLVSPMKAVYVAALFAFIHQLESGVISPRILGNNVGLHPLVVIVAILLGEQLFGTVGLIVGVPLAAILKVTLSRAWKVLLSGPRQGT